MKDIKSYYGSIDKTLSGFRTLTYFIVGGAFLVMLAMGVLTYMVSQNNMFAVDGDGDIVSLSKTSENDLFEIEADNHIRLFYARFFSYDKSNYRKKIEMGLFLGGNSVKRLYETYLNKGWFDVVINNDLVITSSVNDIRFVNENGKKVFYASGSQKVVRGDIVEYRSLDIKGSIAKDVSGRQRILNPHGMKIDDLVLLNNNIIVNEDEN